MLNFIELQFERSPALARAYPRALVKALVGRKNGDWPETVSARQASVSIDISHLAHYRELCGFLSEAAALLVYPHVLAFPLQMALMSDHRFPLNLLGLVHTMNSVEQFQPIEPGERLSIIASVDAHRELDRGREFTLVTRLDDGAGNLVWREHATICALRSRRKSHRRRAPSAVPDFDHHTRWLVPSDIGRRYARVAGDLNPIHLGRWPARLFGFQRAIATGMWLKARAAAEIAPAMSRSAATMSVAFKKPVYLPAEPELRYTCAVDGADFALVDPAQNIIHVTGRLDSVAE